MAVAVPPMLENKTSAIKMFLGSRFNTSHNLEGYLFSNDNVSCLYLLMDYFLNQHFLKWVYRLSAKLKPM